MKKALITVTALTILGTSVPAARAHDHGWSTAGAVLTGVGAGLIISKAFEPPPVYVAPTPVVVQQPATVIVQQPPVQQVVVQQPVPQVVSQPAPVVQAQPVVVQQPTVVYQSAPVVYAPAPAVVYPAPVYVRPYYPPPVIGFRFSFGGGGYHHRHW
jgi:hypothetical protein